jgi:nucleoside phosphorylase
MKKAFVVALKEEVGNMSAIFDVPVYVSGIGKVNAAIAACKLKNQGYNHIVNIGSCGSFKHKIGDIIEIGAVYHNIDATPIVDYGYTPGEDKDHIIINSSNNTCFTTDYFICKSKIFSDNFMKMLNKTDVFDMEAYGLAKACIDLDISFSCHKWVSDNGNGGEWEKNKNIGFEKFILKYEKIPSSL